MEKKDVIGILKMLRTAYPRFYANMTKEEAENTINLWLDCFKDDNPVLVTEGVKALINTLKFPPSIADVKEQMYKLTDNGQTAIDCWNCIKKALGNSIYGSFEEFEKLPNICKQFVGSPATLRDWGMDTDFNESVVRGQFLNQYEKLKQREKEEKMIPNDVKQIIDTLADKMALDA